MKSQRLPTISIVTVNFNTDLEIFEQSLRSIAMQKYPQADIEHIVYDGGSTNGSIELAKRFGCKVIVRSDLKEQAEERQYRAIKKARNEILLILEPDNMLPDEHWLEQMVNPFRVDEQVFCVFSAFNCVLPSMSSLSRYCALFGVSDPVLYYLGKSDKRPWHRRQYLKGKIISRTDRYDIVQFDVDSLPTLGDNGTLLRRSVLKQISQDQKTFIHLDIFVQLVLAGFNRFGIVNNCIRHEVGSRLSALIRRRLLYRKRYYEDRRHARSYLVFNPHSLRDWFNIGKYCFFSITIVEPLSESIIGYWKIPDVAWFLHPVVCLSFFLGYSIFYLMQAALAGFRVLFGTLRFNFLNPFYEKIT